MPRLDPPLRSYHAWLLAETPAAGFAGRLLVQLGANVELLEPPEGGPLRSFPPFVEGESTTFAYLAAGMRARPIPAAPDPTDLAEVEILVHDRAELPGGWNEALAAAPLPERGRVVVACTPYGQSGPKRDWQGTELTIFQAGGEGYLQPSGLGYEEFPERPPIGVGRYVGSYQAGSNAALAALAGLRSSRAAGRTERVDVSVQDSQLSVNYLPVSRYVDGVFERRSNRGFSYGGIVRCADGYVEILPIEQHHWESLRELMGDPEWARAPELEDIVERGHRGAEINVQLRAWAAERSVEAVVARAAETGVPCGPYLAPEQLPDDQQFRFRGFFLEGDDGAAVPGPGWQLAGSDKVPHAPAPPAPAGEAPAAAVRPAGAERLRSNASPAPRGAAPRGLKPLAGVRVADFTNMAAGPYGGLMLGLLGADVIRVESRARLDISRRPHPLYGRFDIPNFDHIAGHKRSITLNLKDERGAALARELVAISDVAIENFRPGVMGRLGLGWDDLKAVNPRLVMVSLSAYGQQGPDSHRPGYAPIFAAEGGLGQMSGYPDGPPGEIRNQMDHEAGLLAALLVVALLEQRERSGEGDFADLAAREVAAMLIGESILQALAEGEAPRLGSGHEQWCPHAIFPTSGEDAWLAIAVRSDEEWLHLVELAGQQSLDRPELVAASQRRANREAIELVLRNWTAGQDGHALAARLQAAGIAAEVSMTAEDLIADAHLREREAIVELRHRQYGERATVGAPWRFEAASDVRYDAWSPDLGEHNEEVICGLLGHSPEELARWIEERAAH